MSAFLKTILLATDGSADVAVAATVAADLATRTGAPLHVAHVWQVVAPLTEYYYAMTDDDWQRYEKLAERLLAEMADRLRAGGTTVTGTHLQRGEPAFEIVSLAGELGAGLIVLGSRGLGRVQRLVMGSVSEGVVHQAPCPVLVM